MAAQKRQLALNLIQIVANTAQQCIDGITRHPFAEASTKTTIVLHQPDDGLNLPVPQLKLVREVTSPSCKHIQ